MKVKHALLVAFYTFAYGNGVFSSPQTIPSIGGGILTASKGLDVLKNKTVDAIPKHLDVANLTEKGKEQIKCYTDLGCFPNNPPWSFLPLRPFPGPMSPDAIDVKFYLYTKKSPEVRFNVKTKPTLSVDGPGSDFNADRPYTAIITHGFASDGNAPWMNDLKNAYLKHRDANVFLVDWGKGAQIFNYLQVASNTRIAGAELKRLISHLIEKHGLDPDRIHLMGHSLGAHISSYGAKGNPGIGQLTAFDPAQPGFQGCPDEVRLAKTDAKFVEVIHTNIRPVIPLLGFGLITPHGHVDFYMNGGLIQPGCILPPVNEVNITSIADLGKYPVEVISKWVACSHGRSYEYYTEALAKDACVFWGRDDGIIGKSLDLTTVGRASLVIEKIKSCSLKDCSPIGLDAQSYPARGSFSVTTNAGSPYCNTDPKIIENMRKLKSAGWDEEKNPVKKIADKIKGKVIG